ncbi:MAG: hypothetical protein EOO38_28835 [Cytophagaceae bacterium]|nr:MAG: hypothetical protein EOO38_28835 [Cytophagaceae bacterium]
MTAIEETTQMGVVLLNTALTLLLALRFGYLTRSAKVGAAGGALAIALAPVLTTVAFSLMWRGYIPDRIGMLLWFTVALGAIVCALGAGMRNWWESLPSKNDR